MMWTMILSSVLVMEIPTASAQPPDQRTCQSKDASVRWTPEGAVLENQCVRLVLDFSGGGLTRREWTDKRTGTTVLGPQPSADFSIESQGQILSSSDRSWTVDPPECKVLSHAEILLSIPLKRDGLKVTRHVVLHPGISLIRSWLDIQNIGDAPLQLTSPPIQSISSQLAPLDLRWMSGAECFGDSWRMRSEPISAQIRRFDSYDPPTPQTVSLSGDGVDAQIGLNGAPVWPETGWAYSAHAADVKSHDLVLEVQAGDRISFALARHGHMNCDTTEWDPVCRYQDGEAFQASEGFRAAQGEQGWSYEYRADDGSSCPLLYDPLPGPYGERWRLKEGVIEPFISAKDMHPDPQGKAVRVFIAPKPGKLQIVGSLRNSGNGAPAAAGFRLGSQTYAPWFCLTTPSNGQGVYMGFDTMGHWTAEIEPLEPSGPVPGAEVRVRVAGYSKALSPGEIVSCPKSFFGLFAGDLDEMGQEILEWQYSTQWDWTREPWFPGVRMLGYWMKGTAWGQAGWVGGAGDPEAAYRKVFRTADFMRAVGGDTYHRDWGWWDRAGDWNGPDFRSSGEYLRACGMGQLIYAFIYTVDPQSKVAQDHPDWLANPNTLDQSMQEVIDYEVRLLDEFYRRWGAFQWRNDSSPLAPRDGDDTVLLAQQQGFFEVIRRFLEKHPDCAFQGVNGGGMALNWEYLSLASGFQFTDGQAQQVANYYASYLFPPDKVNNMPDIWDPDRFDPATWMGLLCSNFDMTGDTFDPVKIEGLRLLMDLYHFLESRGVVGRWVRVFHPRIDGDDETQYLQRLTWDRQRGVIITKHAIPGPVTIFPKGLLPDHEVEVGFQVSRETYKAQGAALMKDGIRIEAPAPGELVYLNLPDHPGNALDRVPPSSPVNVRCMAARHMGVPGVALTWAPCSDETWLSHYTVWRDGLLIGRVAKGQVFFDHSAGADPAQRYEVRAVDGSGNASSPGYTPASNLSERRVVNDDGEKSLVFSGTWTREAFPLAVQGVLMSSDEAGASFTVKCHGTNLRIHSRLGAEGGLLSITLDDEKPVTLSCYAADEIPEWPLFERDWAHSGPHTLTVEVLGQPDPRGRGKRVWLDAISMGR